jgi:hypothetical protein
VIFSFQQAMMTRRYLDATGFRPTESMKKSLSFVIGIKPGEYGDRKGGSNTDLENFDESVGESRRHPHPCKQAKATTISVPSGNDSDNSSARHSDSNVLIMDEEAANLEAASALDEGKLYWKDSPFSS